MSKQFSTATTFEKNFSKLKLSTYIAIDLIFCRITFIFTTKTTLILKES